MENIYIKIEYFLTHHKQPLKANGSDLNAGIGEPEEREGEGLEREEIERREEFLEIAR